MPRIDHGDGVTHEFLDLPQLISASGTVRLPGSKSISNRVLLLAALADGETEVRDLLASDDTERMLDALKALGVGITSLGGENWRIAGCGGKFPVRQAELFLGNAGTAFRPLTAALALAGGDYVLKGVARMHERPIGDLVDGLRQLGADITYLGNEGYPPLHLKPASIQRRRRRCRVRGDVSSQFLTGLLMALPLTGETVAVDVVGELISRPYIEITLAIMARFGVQVQREGWQRFTVPAGSRYVAPGTIYVEGDASSASYFLALGAIGGGPLRVEGVGRDSIQGDVRFAEALAKMGARIEMGPNWMEARAPEGGLVAVDLDCNHIPDAAMTLATAALFAKGTTTLRNIASWRVKETDRIAAMATELRKLGAEVEEGEDFIRITPASLEAGGHRYLRRSPHGDVLLAGRLRHAVAHQRPEVRGQDLPGLFRAFRRGDHGGAGDRHRRSFRFGQGYGGRAGGGGAGLRLSGFGCLVPVDRAGRQAQRASPGLTKQVSRPLPPGWMSSFPKPIFAWMAKPVGDAIRTEEISAGASKVAALPAVREALLFRQRAFNTAPGLVGDGRDMGSVVFPHAPLKVFLTASAEARAERRYKQLIEKGFSANLPDLLLDLQQRDDRDSRRSVAPLRQEVDARLLDTTDLTIEQAVNQVLEWSREALQ